MPADFLANDFTAIARAMRKETSSPRAVLHFWDMFSFLTSEHGNVEGAIEEAYVLVASDTGIPVRITTSGGTTLMDSKALAKAVLRYGKGLPT